MQRKRPVAGAILAVGLAGSAAHAQAASAQPAPIPVFDFPQSGVEFETGDTWRFSNQTFRLYGVQSCIRGTTFTNSVGVKRDCGEASLAYAAALIRDVRPRCTAIAQAGAPPVIYTVCAAHVGQNTLDLGTILITEGWAFAATDGNGKPIKFDYAVAEREAQKAQRGLWAAPDLPDPTQILLDAARSAAHP